MYIKEIKDMINLMNENDLTELEIEKEGVRIRLKKGASGIERAVEFIQPLGPSASAQGKPAQGTAESAPKKNVVEIKAPMVGTFYRAPSPEASPYVNVGDTIEAGQVICIIEAMKLMNEIKSEVKGKLIDIQADNAEPVEFGQILFVVEPV